MLTKKQLESIKNELLERKALLEAELERLSKEQISDGTSQDDGDQAVSSSLETLRNSLQNSEYEEYTMILSALDRLDNGTYGICEDCGEEIAEKRLKYYPNAKRCLVCQEAQEGNSF